MASLTKNGKPVGRPPKEIDPKLVADLASIHCTMIEIAHIVGCSVDTLEKRFADVINEAKSQGKSSLRRYQWAAAKKGNSALLIWLGKQILGQRDKTPEEIADAVATGKLYAPQQPLSKEAMVELIQIAKSNVPNGVTKDGTGADSKASESGASEVRQ